jgi:signal transduction histidine kinase
VGTAAMNPLRRALVGLGAVGFVMGVLMVVVIATSDHVADPGVEAALSLIVAWSFVGTGLYAWDRRPDNLTGPLMVAMGFAWFLAQLAASNIPALYAAGLILSSLPFGVLIHLLVAFPSGRLEQGLDRYLVGLAYFLTLVYPLVTILFFDPVTADECTTCPTNPLLVSDEESLVDVLFSIQSGLALCGVGVLIWDLVHRQREADRSERIRNAPVWWAGAAAMFVLALLLLTELGPEEGNFDDYVYYVGLAVLAAIPFAFLFGLLRSKLSEFELELRQSRARIAEAGYAERRRVERDLHDGAQQRLVALALELRMAQAKLDRDPAGAAELLDGAATELAAATAELRELARGLHPAVLTERGLVAALEALARRAPLPVSVEARGTEPASAAAEAAAYFVVAEALTNVARHAHAEEAAISVDRAEGRLEVEVRDDGRGGANTTNGSGLRGLAERVAALDGRLEVASRAGEGTAVRAVIPTGATRTPARGR